MNTLIFSTCSLRLSHSIKSPFEMRRSSLASGGVVERNLYSQAIENKPINWTILAFVYSFFLYIPQDLIRATVRRREPGT
ncbi:hypothetical protein HBI56_157410 [Parastagonospora nodorum]|nr:hypothetical protein HBH74_160760 [Parastagonospora nodorum]KAH4991533.1 hypothetical protein HBH73_020680 [Parastagonospora nodorum]KAH5052767.1 hypothetical protein HBH96_158000 [Parastagonospora nodorum]KAH5137210.1 hypothetical protein HBH70_115650 [Parastagonospora nodorum]KAH5308928.1 hypothetical protein HBI50_167210 [Parastagonospora nodorum]